MFKSFQIQSVFVWKLLAQTGTDLSTQNCYKPVETALLQLDVYNNLSTSCSNKHGTACCQQAWYKLFQQPVIGLQANNLSTSCWRQLATTCWLNKLVATCSTSCYKLVKSTTCWQDARFYVCTQAHFPGRFEMALAPSNFFTRKSCKLWPAQQVISFSLSRKWGAKQSFLQKNDLKWDFLIIKSLWNAYWHMFVLINAITSWCEAAFRSGLIKCIKFHRVRRCFPSPSMLDWKCNFICAM